MYCNYKHRKNIAAGNQYDTNGYLDFYLQDAVLDDPSVGRKFFGHAGIKDYFESYFIGCNTQTELVALTIQDTNHAHLEVAFTGNFAEGSIGEIFDLHLRRVNKCGKNRFSTLKNNEMSNNNFDDIIHRSLEIRKEYHKLEIQHHSSQWTVEKMPLHT